MLSFLTDLGLSRSALPLRERARHAAPLASFLLPIRSLAPRPAPTPVHSLPASPFTQAHRGAATKTQRAHDQDAAWEEQEWEIFRQWRASRAQGRGARGEDVLRFDLDLGPRREAVEHASLQRQWWDPHEDFGRYTGHRREKKSLAIDDAAKKAIARKRDADLLERIRGVRPDTTEAPPSPAPLESIDAHPPSPAQTYADLLAHLDLPCMLAQLDTHELQRIARFYIALDGWAAVTTLVEAARDARLALLEPLLAVDISRGTMSAAHRGAYHRVVNALLDASTAAQLEAWTAAAQDATLLSLARVMLDLDEQTKRRPVRCDEEKHGIVADGVLDRLRNGSAEGGAHAHADCTAVAMRWMAYFWEMRDFSRVLVSKMDPHGDTTLSPAAAPDDLGHATADALRFARDRLAGALAFEVATDLQRVASASAALQTAAVAAGWTDTLDRLVEDWVIFDGIDPGATRFLRFLRCNPGVGRAPFALRLETVQAVYAQLDRVGLALRWKVTRAMLQRGMPLPPGHTITPLIAHIEGLKYPGQRTLLVDSLHAQPDHITGRDWSVILQEMIKYRWWSYIPRVHQAANASPARRDVLTDPALKLALATEYGRLDADGTAKDLDFAHQAIRDFAAASGPLQSLHASHLSALARAFVAVGADRAALRAFGYMVDGKDPPSEEDIALLVSTVLLSNPSAGLRLLQRAVQTQALRSAGAMQPVLAATDLVEDPAIVEQVRDMCSPIPAASAASLEKQRAVSPAQRIAAQQQALDRHLRAKEYTLALRVVKQLFGSTSTQRSGPALISTFDQVEGCLRELVEEDPGAVDWVKLRAAFHGWRNHEVNQVTKVRMRRLWARVRLLQERCEHAAGADKT